jgi:hypothetical protein
LAILPAFTPDFSPANIITRIVGPASKIPQNAAVSSFATNFFPKF